MQQEWIYRQETFDGTLKDLFETIKTAIQTWKASSVEEGEDHRRQCTCQLTCIKTGKSITTPCTPTALHRSFDRIIQDANGVLQAYEAIHVCIRCSAENTQHQKEGKKEKKGGPSPS